MSITTVEEVKERWVGDWEDLGISDTQIQIFIDDLENQASYAIPHFTENVEADQPPRFLVVQVVSNAIKEYIIASQSPYASQSQNNSEYSRSITSSERYRRKLALNDDEIASLRPQEERGGEAFMISMGSPRRGWSNARLWNTNWGWGRV